MSPPPKPITYQVVTPRGNVLHLIDNMNLSLYLPFPKQALIFTCLQFKPFENTVGKGEIARNEQFLLFPQCFLRV